MMSIRDLMAGYGRIGVLRGVTLTIDEGSCVGILGHNGMGKTTLLKTIMGLLPATGGEITLAGRSITALPTNARARLGLGYVPQGRQIFPQLTVRDNLLFAIAAKGRVAAGVLDGVLADFPELERLLDRRGGALSGGEQQLLALARALCGSPSLLLLDEPTEGIQPSIVQALSERIHTLRRRRSLTVLLVEQNLEFIRSLASRVLRIHRGRIIEEISGAALDDAALVHPLAGKATCAKEEQMPLGTLKPLTLDQLRDVARELGMTLSNDELVQHQEALAPSIAAYNLVDQMPDEVPLVRYPRTPGYRPVGEENRYGAWYVKTTIEGAPSGKLKGKTVALKDNICLAGVPMMNGASTLEGYTPDIDATVVQRILDAGGTIVGKTVCEYFCFSGGSHTSASGPVHNPHRMGYSAGGSSSGSAAVLAAGEVPMALGGDQGGSIRMPASFCGIYGMKPTHGLIPYTGIMPIELTLDHTGPMSATVEDNSLLLEVLAGPDGLDPRQYGRPSKPYREALGLGAKGLRIAVVEEGFGHPQSQAASDALVRAAAERFKGLGAAVETVSIPMHRLGAAIWLPIAAEGATVQMMQGNGFGFNWQGLYVTSLLDFHSSWRGRADELSESLKNTMLLGHYMVTRHRGHYYAKAQNLVRRLRAAYDAVLAQYDLLLMPTLPMTATPLPSPEAPTSEIIQRAFEVLPNTAAFDCTHHPAMSLPCAMLDGLPVGMMLVGKMYDEETIYRTAAAFEAGVDWRRLS